MNSFDDMYNFINDPETVDFIMRDNEYFREFVRRRADILLTQRIAGRYIIGYVSRANVESLIRDLGTGVVSATPLILGLLGRESLEAAGILQVQQQPFLDLRGRGVLIGLVDTGIDYTNESFIYEDGRSKIQFLYDQSIIGTPPQGFFIGTDYTNEQINQALVSENPYDIVPSRDLDGHGTFLASVAAGRDIGENIGAAPDADLIVVKLKTARNYIRERFLIPPDQVNAFESTAVMVGILGRPVAICIGIGTNSGSHDGFTLFEEYLSSISNQTGVCLCIAAGNESEARHHTQGVVPETGAFSTIEVRAGMNAGDIYINIWNTEADRLSVAVRSPTGELVSRVPARSGTVHTQRLVLERSTVIIEYYFPVEGSGGQVTIVKILNATQGIWTIQVYGDIILDGVFHSWLPLTGFVSPNVEFLAPTPYYTVVVPGTALGVITVGAYNSLTNTLYSRSSWGPTRLPMMSPDFVAPGADVIGVYPTGIGAMSGTGVAAAIATGAGALMLQWGVVEGNDPAMSTYQIRAFIIRGATRASGLIYPNTQWGYGRLNLIQSFNLMRGV
ncbi:MAG: peptidase [Firmicutes bacterium HGW-Firmicutes-21]|nr:MAG: peptidase [Firmicutes bacterium HGW-Firmicutes-21]